MLQLKVIMQSVTVVLQTVQLLQKMQLLQSQSVAEAGPGSSSSVVQLMLLAVSGGGHSWSV